ncbi:hypothetical protein HanXRQr2_Chr13g0589651 [Helianthus annuus]|uniref:Uncharacterized protein n=1 Tax=Helianthus annuus TaxID=4232 RepID=A0A9K3EGX4_HELAN|nr:hypothetical protein HanXRQr2_Chr13g0589651 [Helianthus annuus]KAJ0849367.1 hypothetical protein HanPSC8_Chr13g0567961 [Helianthus annuus]
MICNPRLCRERKVMEASDAGEAEREAVGGADIEDRLHSSSSSSSINGD